MKDENGFTLVELLAVITILGFIALIFVPKVSGILSDNELRVYRVKEQTIKSAASDYMLEKRNDSTISLPSLNDTLYIKIDTLISNNNMSKVIDTTSGNECVGYVKVTKNGTYDYNYDVCLICDNYVTEKDFCTRKSWSSLS